MKRTRLLVALIAMGMIVGPFVVEGWAQAEYYVCARDGADQPGNGSAANPWASITYALSQIELSEEEPTAVIYVFEGTYYENVVMRDNIGLKGSYVHEGDDHTTGTRSFETTDPVTGEPRDPSSIIYSTVDIQDTVVGANALLEGFVISGGSNGIHCSDGATSIVQNLIKGNYVTGIMCVEAPISLGDNKIRNNNRHGIHIVGDRSAPIKIVGNEISDNGASGIYVDVGPMVACPIGAVTELEQSNYIHDNYVSGILVVRASNNVLIIRNWISANNRCGICVCEDSTPDIQANVIEMNSMTGISISFSSKGANISGNLIRLNVGQGILVQCTSAPDISNNVILWNERDGIRFQGLAGGGGTRLTAGNEILWNFGNGITCTDESDPSIVQGNIIAGNASNGIYCDMKSKPNIEEALIYANSVNGIVSSYHSEPTIERCIISSNLRNGVETKGSSLPSLINNVIADNSEHGFSCNNYSRPTIRNCIISGNNGYGIFEAASISDPAEVSYCSFYQNQEGDYRDESIFTYTGANAINGSVDNRGNVVSNNIDGDPLFVAWGSFSLTNPMYVDVDTNELNQDGTEGRPFDLIMEALIQYDYSLAQGSPCIGMGQGGVDIGAYPDASSHGPKGSDAVGVTVSGGKYYETNLVLNHNVAANGNSGARVIGVPFSREPSMELPEFLSEGTNFTIFYAETGSTIESFLEIAEGRTGVFVDRGFVPTIRDCSLVKNGNGIVCFHSAPLIQGNTFINSEKNGVICETGSPRIVENDFMNGAVGVLCKAGAAPEISSCTLTGHSVAGILCRDRSSPIVMTSLVELNSGDGIYIEDLSAPIIKNTEIVANDRNGISIVGGSTPIITGSEILHNKIYGIRCSTNASPTIAGNIVSHNIWDGIYVFDHSSPSIINNMIYRNRANGIYIESYSAPEIINNTLAFNLNNGIFMRDQSTPIIRNTLIYYHKGFGVREYGQDSDPADFSNNCLAVSFLGQYLDEGLTIYWTGDDINSNVDNNGAPVANNIHAGDPGFVDADADDYHLVSDSPCVDVGTSTGAPKTDFDGDVRPQGAGYDIGADEYTPGGGSMALGLDENLWEFVTMPATFSRPTGLASESGISIISSDNTNTFGYWCGVGQPVPVVSDCLYRFRFQVSTTLTDPSRVPAVRLRLNTGSSEQSDLLQISSGETGSCSPTPMGMVYDLYAYPPQKSTTVSMGTDVFYVSFDIMNFDPSDAATAGVSLQGVEVSRVPLGNLSGRQELQVYDFESGSESWRYSGTIPPFSAPLSGWASGCLQLRSTTNTDTFGFWSGDPGEVALDTIGKLYRGTFTVSSDQVDRTKVACMRLRMASGDGQESVVKTINSPNPTTEAPGLAALDYTVYFLPMQGVLGSGLLSGFDMLNFDLTDDPQVTLNLEKVIIETFDIPTAP